MCLGHKQYMYTNDAFMNMSILESALHTYVLAIEFPIFSLACSRPCANAASNLSICMCIVASPPRAKSVTTALPLGAPESMIMETLAACLKIYRILIIINHGNEGDAVRQVTSNKTNALATCANLQAKMQPSIYSNQMEITNGKRNCGGNDMTRTVHKLPEAVSLATLAASRIVQKDHQRKITKEDMHTQNASKPN